MPASKNIKPRSGAVASFDNSYTAPAWLLITGGPHPETGIPEGFGPLHRNTGIPKGLVSETQAKFYCE
jgi:hypothetical protein